MTVAREQLDALRKRLLDGRASLRAAYEEKSSANHLLRAQARLVDGVLVELWDACALPTSATLVAVGGYGRGELYPCSDVDILLLLAGEPEVEVEACIERFVGHLWDLGLDIGHSVRTLEECQQEAERDVTVQTNLLESRRLHGSRALYQNFVTQICGRFDVETFFHAKRAEQEQRYNRFNATPYALEPNCKESPGGLRDLQTVTWVSLACGLGTRWQDLCRHGLMTVEEVHEVQRAERFMQHVRIRLHHLSGRREDRLIFDVQEALARSFGITATDTRRASEQLMQRYYRAAKTITQINTLLLQNLALRFQSLADSIVQPIDAHFRSVGDLLDITSENVFEQHPPALLEAFLHMMRHPELKGMTTRTLRALWHGQRLIDAAFRRDPVNRRNFLALFQQPRGQTTEFRRMNQYGILGAYLPAFGRIVGQMQHDLFHVYTVDQHILQVLRNARRFSLEEHAHEYPLMTRLMSAFDAPWLIYIAALFHDIAKGRGGDHSKLGMSDAGRFAREHGLSREDGELLVWLVEHHLTMSQVAQKQDLGDPDVIRKFAALCGSERRLNALYLLTHADIRGTSPKVWNGWKARLLEELFLASRQLLRGNAPEQVLGIADRQQKARQALRFHGLSPGAEDALWREFDTLYFLRHDVDEVVWHTRMLYYRPRSEEPVVKARPNRDDEGLQVMVYIQDQRDLFARLCGYFARMGFTIMDAKIHTTGSGWALDSFMLLDAGCGGGDYRDVIALIEHELTERLRTAAPVDTPAPARLSRQTKHFPITPSVSLQPDESGRHFVLSIIATDRPGLLYHVARTLAEHDINLHTAKIATLGERAEDTFLVSGSALGHSGKTVQLESDLIERLKV